MKKHTIDDVYKIINDRNYNITIVKSLIKNKRSHFLLYCANCGKEWLVIYSNISKKHWVGCLTCYKEKNRLLYKERFKELLSTSGYQLFSEYYTNKKKVYLKHIDCHRMFYMKPDSFTNGNRCPFCSINQLVGIEEFRKRLYNIYKNDYVVLEPYINMSTKILVKHKCDYEYRVTPIELLRHGCAKCAGNLKKSHSQFEKEFYDIVTDNEYSILSTYESSNTKIKLKHNICLNIFYMAPKCFLYANQRCPHCSKSKGEQKIVVILKHNNIKFEQEYSFMDCKNINVLRFDFAVFRGDDLICLIEYDGIQHYKQSKLWGIDSFKATIRNDKIKNEYCKSRNIELIRIPYYNYKHIEDILTTNHII